MGSVLCYVLAALLLVVKGPVAESTGFDAITWSTIGANVSLFIIPGFASTQLRAWAMLDCPFSPLGFNPLDSVWLDSRKVIAVTDCWLKCMLLDPYNQTDHPECKSRPDTGISAIIELDPGYITGPLSSVWREWVHWCVEFGIDANGIVAAPYDWRLPGSVLEERDLYFHRLKLSFETALKLRGGPAIVFAHSLGNNVFRYFLEWLRLEIAPKLYQQWLDTHIHAYVSLGGFFLGSPEAVKATFSGVNFGLPIAEGTSRLMCDSFGATLWMFPFSKYCYENPKAYRRILDGIEDKVSVMCDENEDSEKFSGWPVDVVKVDIPQETNASCFGVSEEAAANLWKSECSIPDQHSFSARKIADGTLFQKVGHVDPDNERAIYQLNKYILNDPLFNALTPWERPPIKNIICAYGVNLRTEVGYHFSPSGKPYPNNWIISDIIYETEGGNIQSRVGASVAGNAGPASGDATIPYHSLSWCKTWLGPSVNVTRTPQNAHDGSEFQEILDMDHQFKADIVPNISRDGHQKYVTYYEDGVGILGKRTAVWEFDKVNHRNIVRSPVFMREIFLEMLHSLHPDAERKFISKVVRYPIRDDDCYWDYTKARCAMPEYCEYRYIFGDVHLGQSCRLKASPHNILRSYF